MLDRTQTAGAFSPVPSPKSTGSDDSKASVSSVPFAAQEGLATIANALSLSKEFLKWQLFSLKTDNEPSADAISEPFIKLLTELKSNPTDAKKREAAAILDLTKKEKIRSYLATMDETHKKSFEALFEELYKLCDFAFSSHEALSKKTSRMKPLESLTTVRETLNATIDSILADKKLETEQRRRLVSFKTMLGINVNDMMRSYQLLDNEKTIAEQTKRIQSLESQEREEKTRGSELDTTLTTAKKMLELQQDSITSQTGKITTLVRSNNELTSANEQLKLDIQKTTAEKMHYQDENASLKAEIQTLKTSKTKSTPWLKYSLYFTGFLLGCALIATGLGAPIGVSLATACLAAGGAFAGSGLVYGAYRAVKNCFVSSSTDDAPDGGQLKKDGANNTHATISSKPSSPVSIYEGLKIDVYDETDTSALTSKSSDSGLSSPTINRHRQFNQTPRVVGTYQQDDEFVSAADIRFLT